MNARPAALFRFLPVDRVLHGPGAAESLPWELDRLGARRALIITGASIAGATDLLWYVEQLLGPRHAASYSGVRAHVPAASVAAAVEFAGQAGIDCLVSLGGGSAIDTAKAVAHRMAQAAEGPPLPHLALPTTLSAAEFTHYYGVTDEAAAVKHGAGDARLAPRVVLLDPRLTVATPETLWLSTGIKALDHAVESFLSDRAHPVTDTLALEAITRLFAALPRCAADAGDLSARLDCQLGAWMSLFSPATVRGGASHAIGHQLGAHGVSHGITSCVTLARVLRALPAPLEPRLARLLAAMQAGGAVEQSAADAVAGLVARLGLTARLRDCGIDRNLLPRIAAAATVELGAEQPLDVAALLDTAW